MAVRKRTRGRPSEFTTKNKETILDAISKGLNYKQAATLAGISYDTFNRWRNAGEQPDGAPEFRDFCNALEQAKAKLIYDLSSKVIKATERDWKAAEKLIERLNSDQRGSGKASGADPKAEQSPDEVFLTFPLLREMMPMSSLVKIAEECLPRLKAMLAEEAKVETSFKNHFN